jgi:rhodanese-related sulfurtransferase
MLQQASRCSQRLLPGRCTVAPLRTTSKTSPLRRRTLQQHNISAANSGTPASIATKENSQYPDPTFCKAVLSAFPAQGTCFPEEARVLYSVEYAFLDVRSNEELDSEGKLLPKMPGVFHVPIYNFAKRYDAAKGRKVVDKTVNDKFLAAVEKLVPNKEQGLIIVCSGVPSRGKLRSTQALETLSEAGYKQLVVLNGGFPVSESWCMRPIALWPINDSTHHHYNLLQAWSVLFTNKLERRVVGFVIASGGTSIEQSTGVSSKGSGVSGKDVNSLLNELLMNYKDGGLYADA